MVITNFPLNVSLELGFFLEEEGSTRDSVNIHFENMTRMQTPNGSNFNQYRGHVYLKRRKKLIKDSRKSLKVVLCYVLFSPLFQLYKGWCDQRVQKQKKDKQLQSDLNSAFELCL